MVLRIIRWRHLLSKVTICCDAILTLLAAIALEEVVWHEKVIMGVGTSSLYIKINHLISSQSKQGIGFVSRSEETPYKELSPSAPICRTDAKEDLRIAEFREINSFERILTLVIGEREEVDLVLKFRCIVNT